MKKAFNVRVAIQEFVDYEDKIRWATTPLHEQNQYFLRRKTILDELPPSEYRKEKQRKIKTLDVITIVAVLLVIIGIVILNLWTI